MPQSTFEKFLPASGVLAGVLFVVSGFAARLPESADDDALAVLRGHAVANSIAMIATALFAIVLVFFAAGLRSALRSGESGESTYSSVAFGGALVLAGVMATQAWLALALVDVTGTEDAGVAQALGALSATSWVPFLVGCCPMLVATGLGGLRNAVLPKWLAVVTVVLGALCVFGPTGFAVFFAMPFWLVVTGVVVSLRQRTAVAPTEPALA